MTINTGMFKPPPSPPIPVVGKLQVVIQSDERRQGLSVTWLRRENNGRVMRLDSFVPDFILRDWWVKAIDVERGMRDWLALVGPLVDKQMDAARDGQPVPNINEDLQALALDPALALRLLQQPGETA